jgi:hypothetical protein
MKRDSVTPGKTDGNGDGVGKVKPIKAQGIGIIAGHKAVVR